MELLLTYEDEGIYIDIYGHFTKETVLQWGEMPASVGMYKNSTLLNVRFCCMKPDFFVRSVSI